jgi:succinate dehydrogenase/fumarate reductase flavoprotein subunit
MRTQTLELQGCQTQAHLTVHAVHTLIIGSGAAGLNAAVQLHRNGVADVLIVTDGLDKGTSINTGSDKQTYYKLSLCGTENDSPATMAENYLHGGSMHGDLALVEASLSPRAFFNLVNLGVPFPRDAYGQFVGYKTDHDPRQRATSIGPYTSREMCRRLIAEVLRLGIPIHQGREVIQLVRADGGDQPRIAGALTLNEQNQIEAYVAENIVFAVGGPGGLYKTSVYPEAHFGSIGLALMAGANACNLPESQYGLASTQFRWNVSGTYMQVIPRFISRAANGRTDEREFLLEYFDSTSEMNGNVFLKGYQWPFDARKAIGGSSLIDILVYIETVERGRRVFLDFRSNPCGYSLEGLPEEARSYLVRSGADQPTPIQRLSWMNPGAIALYREHGINLEQEPLEIAVCAQHNNGGLEGNLWWESTNLKHFFPIGEVNGSHGVSRPGGSALNAGQVGGFRAAEYIANRYAGWTLDESGAVEALQDACRQALDWLERGHGQSLDWQTALEDLQARMTRNGAHIRTHEAMEGEVATAQHLVEQLLDNGCRVASVEDWRYAFRVRQLAFAHRIYLEAIRFMLVHQVGSRGSAIVLAPDGEKIHPALNERWRIMPESQSYRNQILQTSVTEDGTITHRWICSRPIPVTDSWFETTWAAFREGKIFD